jgi:hypothetical protein
MEQTAVEWLVDQMLKQGYFDGNKPLSYTNLDHLQNKANEMFKQQIIKSHNVGSKWGFEDVLEEGEQYYKETYENK